MIKETILANGVRNRGFSMIEMLVVITIMIVLSAVALISFGPTNRKSRDSRRMADLEKYRIALEMARQVGSTYPADLTTLVPTYVGATAADPISTRRYLYTRIDSYHYSLKAAMEEASSANISPVAGCGADCNYEIKNP